MIIAMWSGPRNLSTAMMRSFEARSDCTVWDEPFYAAYLQLTGSPHPMADAVIQAYETDPKLVAQACAKTAATPVFYQKHMTHHMRPEMPRDWLKDVTNVFLIRDPARVVASYHAKREAPELADLGFVEQFELFEQMAELTGSAPAVVDAADIRRDPKKTLRTLCAHIGLSFDEAMLSWPPGRRESDGNWGEHWYHSVWRSTGFAPPETEPLPKLGEPLQRVVTKAEPYYRRLAQYALGAGDN